ncbi:MAG: hypothetical protein AVDCRST_MAG16-2639, partial [uncultured Frankineae bacterium]
ADPRGPPPDVVAVPAGGAAGRGRDVAPAASGVVRRARPAGAPRSGAGLDAGQRRRRAGRGRGGDGSADAPGRWSRGGGAVRRGVPRQRLDGARTRWGPPLGGDRPAAAAGAAGPVGPAGRREASVHRPAGL